MRKACFQTRFRGNELTEASADVLLFQQLSAVVFQKQTRRQNDVITTETCKSDGHEAQCWSASNLLAERVNQAALRDHLKQIGSICRVVTRL